MANVKAITRYSDEFENVIAEYIYGDENIRDNKIFEELYLKVNHAKSFFDTCNQYLTVKGCRFLEVGCGTGIFSVGAALSGASVAATDYVEKAVNLAKLRWREHGVEGEIFQSDLRQAPPSRRVKAYDFVFCFQVIEHIPRQDQFSALANLFSMVKPGGFLFIDTENSLAPFDRHDSQTWLLRYLTKPVYEDILVKLGRGLDFLEPSTGGRVQTRDYLSYDELIGAAGVSGFEVVSPYMPHGNKAQMLRMLTGSDWLHDSVLKHVDIERFAPISLLLRRQ